MKKILLLLFLVPTLLFGQTVTLDGSASVDPDGSITAYKWRLVSGPGVVNIANMNIGTTTVTAVWIVGVYTFELEVTDNKGAKSTDVVTVTVSANPDKVTINAGSDQTVTLPLTKITLTGTASDPVTPITAYAWTMISGPNSVVIMTSNAAQTDVTNLIAGVYKFRFKATSGGGASAADTIQVTVTSANQPPASNAGPDKVITLPVSVVSIGLPDAPGLTVQWVKISGPSGGIIISPNNSITNIVSLGKGDYVYRKIVRNSAGIAGSDDMNIKVKAKCSWWAKLLGWC